MWDRNWAEWDWFADRIIDKERLKPEPDSVVVVGVRRGANWQVSSTLYNPPAA